MFSVSLIPRITYLSGCKWSKSLQVKTLNLISSFSFSSASVLFRPYWSKRQKRFPSPILAIKDSRFYLLEGITVANALSKVLSLQKGRIKSAIRVLVRRMYSSVRGPLESTC